VLELFVVLTGAGLELEGVALTETLAEAGLVGAPVPVGASVASDVRLPVSEYRAAQSLRLVPCVRFSRCLSVKRGMGDVRWGSTMCRLSCQCSNILHRRHFPSRHCSSSLPGWARSSEVDRRWRHTERCRLHRMMDSHCRGRIGFELAGILDLDGPSSRELD
jgi:hypothetical protein